MEDTSEPSPLLTSNFVVVVQGMPHLMFIMVEYASNLICFVNIFFPISTFCRQFFSPNLARVLFPKNLDKALDLRCARAIDADFKKMAHDFSW